MQEEAAERIRASVEREIERQRDTETQRQRDRETEEEMKSRALVLAICRVDGLLTCSTVETAKPHTVLDRRALRFKTPTWRVSHPSAN